MINCRILAHTPYSLFTTLESGETPHFILTRASSFKLLAEPSALSFLYRGNRRGESPSAEVRFAIPEPGGVDASSAGNLGILNSLFGLALLDACDTVRDRTGRDIQTELFSALWKSLISHKGILGAGDYVAFVSRDPDMPVPEILRDPARAGDRRTFPFRATFSRVLRAMAAEMGIAPDLGVSSAEEALLTFLYEVARNAHEHGRAQDGVRGIVVQKFRALSREELERREVFPEEMSPYLSRIWSPRSAKGVLIAITIVDTGPGIHRTLPEKPNETEWDRLCRALVPGESRKPTGLPGRGEGLSNVIQALNSCEVLRAFLVIRSGDLRGYKDFTAPGVGQRNIYALSRWPQGTLGTTGSALTLLWPILDHADQKALPLVEES